MTRAAAEIAQIVHLKTDKRRAAQAYFINGTRGRGTVSVRLGTGAYWALTSDPVADMPEREAAIARANGDPWEGCASWERKAPRPASTSAAQSRRGMPNACYPA